MMQARTVGIVGVGHVGAHVADCLLAQGLADEIVLCDIDAGKLASEVQDLRDSLSFRPCGARVSACGDRYEELAGCDIVVNAAGSVARSSESRDGELFYTTDACRMFARHIVDAGFQGIWLSIANPCDVVALEFAHLTGYDPARIIGSGCALDSARLRTQVSLACGGLDPASVDAYMIGEHGFSQIAAWKSASIAGIPLDRLAETDPERFGFDRAKVEELARRGGYVTMAGKHCTEYAVANAAARIVRAVFFDEHAVLAVSSLLTGQYGEADVFASLPCVVGRAGVERVLEPELSEDELAGFRASCAHIRENVGRLSWW